MKVNAGAEGARLSLNIVKSKRYYHTFAVDEAIFREFSDFTIWVAGVSLLTPVFEPRGERTGVSKLTHATRSSAAS